MMEDDIKDQLYNLNNLGFNKLSDMNELSDDFIYQFLRYSNDNYIPIPNYQSLVTSDVLVRHTFKLLYKFYAVDFVKEFLPYINSSNLQESCKKVIDYKLKNLERLSNIVSIKTEIESYRFYSMLVDSDLSNFISNYLIPLTYKYRFLIPVS